MHIDETDFHVNGETGQSFCITEKQNDIDIVIIDSRKRDVKGEIVGNEFPGPVMHDG